MHAASETMLTLNATVEEQLPRLGLAYVVDDEAHSWGVTRSTLGGSFDALTPGRRVQLLIESNRTYSMVRECRLVE
jgi:hypothetical protein